MSRTYISIAGVGTVGCTKRKREKEGERESGMWNSFETRRGEFSDSRWGFFVPGRGEIFREILCKYLLHIYRMEFLRKKLCKIT